MHHQATMNNISDNDTHIRRRGSSTTPLKGNGSSGMIVDRPAVVSFSPTSEMYIIPQDSTKSMFYSQEDIDIFKRNSYRDALQMRRHFASGEEISGDVLYDSMGLENFASQDVHQRIVMKRRAHISAVLQEQQRGTNSSIDSIAMVSMIYSGWARMRAEKIALSYMRLGEVV